MKIGLIVAVLCCAAPLRAEPAKPVVDRIRLSNLFVSALELGSERMAPQWTKAERVEALDYSVAKFGSCARREELSADISGAGIEFTCPSFNEEPDTLAIRAEFLTAADPFFEIVRTKKTPAEYALKGKDGAVVSRADIASAWTIAVARVEARTAAERAQNAADSFSGPCP